MLLSLSYVLVIVPQMTSLYKQLEAEVDLTWSYLVIFAVLALGLANIFTAIRLFSRVETVKQKFFRIGLILLFVSLAGFALYYAVAFVSVINPIYSLSTSR